MKLLAFIAVMAVTPAPAHDWIVDGGYVNSTGTRCCDSTDCGVIQDDVAWRSGLGDDLTVTIENRDRLAIVNVIFPSRDPFNRSFACTTGCLFRAIGG